MHDEDSGKINQVPLPLDILDIHCHYFFKAFVEEFHKFPRNVSESSTFHHFRIVH